MQPRECRKPRIGGLPSRPSTSRALLPAYFVVGVLPLVLPSACAVSGAGGAPERAADRPSAEHAAASGAPQREAPSPFSCEPSAPVDPGPSPLQRLTHEQYRATVRELFGEVDLASVLPEPGHAGHIGLAQPDPSLVDVEAYGLAALRVSEHVAEQLGRFAPCNQPEDPESARLCAREFLDGKGPVIYRGPLDEGDATDLLMVFDVGYRGGGYAHGIELLVRTMLQSPRFLYRPELGRQDLATAHAVPLTDYELATRLSFAFWNQGPDSKLLAKAESGLLSAPGGLEQEVQRLVQDPRAKTTFRRFLFTWLGLNDLNTVEKDPVRYPAWSASTPEHMRI